MYDSWERPGCLIYQTFQQNWQVHVWLCVLQSWIWRFFLWPSFHEKNISLKHKNVWNFGLDSWVKNMKSVQSKKPTSYSLGECQPVYANARKGFAGLLTWQKHLSVKIGSNCALFIPFSVLDFCVCVLVCMRARTHMCVCVAFLFSLSVFARTKMGVLSSSWIR